MMQHQQQLMDFTVPMNGMAGQTVPVQAPTGQRVNVSSPAHPPGRSRFQIASVHGLTPHDPSTSQVLIPNGAVPGSTIRVPVQGNPHPQQQQAAMAQRPSTEDADLAAAIAASLQDAGGAASAAADPAVAGAIAMGFPEEQVLRAQAERRFATADALVDHLLTGSAGPPPGSPAPAPPAPPAPKPPHLALYKAAEAAGDDAAEVGRLLKAGADPNETNPGRADRTPLHIAAAYGRAAVAELLLQNKASVDAPNENGNTPLWLAAGNGQAAVAELLLAAGADRTKEITSGDYKGYTPAQIAKLGGHHALAARLG
eukprot:SAG22_NODE_27_length_29018_cov_465.809646_23_plen_313_part_00